MTSLIYKTFILVLPLIRQSKYECNYKTQNVEHKTIVNKNFKDCVKKKLKNPKSFPKACQKRKRGELHVKTHQEK